MSFKAGKAYIFLVGFLGLYTVGYAIARISIFHAVENYPFGKGGPRQDYITKKNHQPGQGWEYQLFLPAIKIEEYLIAPKTDLSDADLSDADLRNADLRNADLSGIKFWDKKSGNETKNITPEQIKKAKNWDKAIYSPEFRKKLGLPPEE